MTNVEQQIATSVLVIGTGGSGLRAAIELAERGIDVLIVGKRPKTDAHTTLAAGGINAALATMDADDTWQQHAADTLTESYLLADPMTVQVVTEGAAESIRDLERYGMAFAREQDGRISQRFFGAHTFRRTAFAGDYTGLELQRTLIRRAAQLAIPILDSVYITTLLVRDNVIFGAYGFNLLDGTRYTIHSDAVILATGGHTRIWRRTSSRRDENTGDSFRLALEAGGRIRDPELVQFHPSGLIEPEDSAGTLVSEAARGEGGILRNDLGERFMKRYDPDRMELSTRDRVALAAYTEIKEGRGTPARRCVAGRLAPAADADHGAPPARLSDLDGPAAARHHHHAHRDRSHGALLDGRRMGSPRRSQHRRRRSVRDRRSIERAARSQPARRELADRTARLRQDRRPSRRRLLGSAQRPTALPCRGFRCPRRDRRDLGHRWSRERPLPPTSAPQRHDRARRRRTRRGRTTHAA